MQPTDLWMTTTSIWNDHHNEQPMAQLTTVNCAAAVAKAITDHARRAGHGDHVDGISALTHRVPPLAAAAGLGLVAVAWVRRRADAYAMFTIGFAVWLAVYIALAIFAVHLRHSCRQNALSQLRLYRRQLGSLVRVEFLPRLSRRLHRAVSVAHALGHRCRRTIPPQDTAPPSTASTMGIPPNRGDIVYEEALCHTHDASTTRSSGPVLCGSSGRREGRSLRSPATATTVCVRLCASIPSVIMIMLPFAGER